MCNKVKMAPVSKVNFRQAYEGMAMYLTELMAVMRPGKSGH